MVLLVWVFFFCYALIRVISTSYYDPVSLYTDAYRGPEVTESKEQQHEVHVVRGATRKVLLGWLGGMVYQSILIIQPVQKTVYMWPFQRYPGPLHPFLLLAFILICCYFPRAILSSNGIHSSFVFLLLNLSVHSGCFFAWFPTHPYPKATLSKLFHPPSWFVSLS